MEYEFLGEVGKHPWTVPQLEEVDLVTLVVEACRAKRVNPFDYTMAIVRNTESLNLDPTQRMPWNFHITLAEFTAPGG